MKDVGEILVGQYRVDGLIKKIGEVEVYKGLQLSIQKNVLIEIFPLEIGKSLKLEDFFAMTRLSHPNLLSLIDYGETVQESFLVFEMPEGETLREIIKREGKLSFSRATRIISQIASALQAAHSKGVVHGRLNPENVFVCHLEDAELVKVFGFASYSYSETPSIEEAHYLAPEQFSNFHMKDARCDVYALGVIAYELLTGQVPFSFTNIEDFKLLDSSLSFERKNLPEKLAAVIKKALAKNPEDRFQNIKDFVEHFEPVVSFSAEQEILEKEVALSNEKLRTHNIWKTAFIVLLGILALGGFFIYLTQTKQVNPPTKLPTDSGSTPVQPVSPATGAEERALSDMKDFGTLSNSKVEVVKQSKSSNPWASGEFVPPPTGQFYDGNVNPNSPFMAPDGNIYVLVPKNSNVEANSNSKESKISNSNVNTQAITSESKKKNDTTTQETKVQQPSTTPKTTPQLPSNPASNKQPSDSSGKQPSNKNR